MSASSGLLKGSLKACVVVDHGLYCLEVHG